MSTYPEKILHVDDDPTILDLVQRIFAKESDVDLVSCQNAENFIELLESTRPDLILMDLKMPALSGPDLLEKMQSSDQKKNIPIIFVTGVGKMEMTEEYRNLNVVGIIHKPFKKDEFLAKIREFYGSESVEPQE